MPQLYTLSCLSSLHEATGNDGLARAEHEEAVKIWSSIAAGEYMTSLWDYAVESIN